MTDRWLRFEFSSTAPRWAMPKLSKGYNSVNDVPSTGKGRETDPLLIPSLFNSPHPAPPERRCRYSSCRTNKTDPPPPALQFSSSPPLRTCTDMRLGQQSQSYQEKMQLQQLQGEHQQAITASQQDPTSDLTFTIDPCSCRG